MAAHTEVTTARGVVLFPFPFRSHITPMLQLARLLHARGLAVTVLHTDFNAPDPARHPEFTFVSIHESLPNEVAAPDADMVKQMLGLNAACEAPFQEALASLVRGQEPPGVACTVVDGQFYAMLGAAKDVGVPVLALRTDSAATFHVMLNHSRLCASGYMPIKEETLDKVVPWLEPLRVRDLIRVDGSEAEAVSHFIIQVIDAMRASEADVVVNTSDAIEASDLVRIQQELSRRAFAVGPLHLLCPAPLEHGLHAPDRGCLDWLDAHPPRSVLYVSLGSVARIDRRVFEEMAWGLAGSGVPFLWVVRPGLTSDNEEAPQWLDTMVGSTGKVVTWAPQREVLAHPATGGFWTHCGWNSTLESICEGVPMLVQPCFGDQTVNARYVTYKWGVGMDVGDVIERTAVTKAVRSLMVGPEGAVIRHKARDFKERASECLAEGGPASVAIDNLVEYILHL